MAWRKAKAMLDDGAIGRLRHVVVTWNVENESTRRRLKNWKTSGGDGGGALGNFVSHSLHAFEWFCGPMTGLSARLSGLPDDPAMETTATASLAFVLRRRRKFCHELCVLSWHWASSGILRRGGDFGARQSDHRLHARLHAQPCAPAGCGAGADRDRARPARPHSATAGSRLWRVSPRAFSTPSSSGGL